MIQRIKVEITIEWINPPITLVIMGELLRFGTFYVAV